jgi:hypothetical protein
MSSQPYLRPTATQQIRTFLAGAGEAIPPWAGFDEVMDHLWMALHGRRDNDEFWKGLEKLVESLSCELFRDYGDALPDPRAEILSEGRIGGLVLELQQAMKSSRKRPGPGVMKGFLDGLRAPLAGCVILVGVALAAGCKVASGERNEAAVELTPSMVIDGSKLAPSEKETLKSCVDRMTEAKQGDLEALFRTRTPDQIAAALEEMLGPGGECAAEPEKTAAAGTPVQDNAAAAAAESQPADEGRADAGQKKPKKLRKKSLPEPQPLYKGVMF